ncbi:MAG: flavin reductase family protein [Thermoproteus sp. AZ2]|jgi:flavin reductase (DIM6/NTAB) family NADH-FMN oxidoreductase RutF|uniref:Flavin reductase family protein n=1 Tax=Thermoproteus sp. AZ2 TaxID=1609232 RepID=A0ACC6V0F5_9CREN|nr:MAG: flavin reductase [Thermoproteus sp. AZ2]
MSCELSPLPTPLVVVVAGDGGAVIGWPLVIPGSPPLIALPFAPGRRTLEAVRRARYFSLNLVKDYEKAVEIFGSEGRDKLKRWGGAVPCERLACLRLPDASRWVECEYAQELEVEGHVLVLCKAVYWSGCGEYAIWDPCRKRR